MNHVECCYIKYLWKVSHDEKSSSKLHFMSLCEFTIYVSNVDASCIYTHRQNNTMRKPRTSRHCKNDQRCWMWGSELHIKDKCVYHWIFMKIIGLYFSKHNNFVHVISLSLFLYTKWSVELDKIQLIFPELIYIFKVNIFISKKKCSPKNPLLTLLLLLFNSPFITFHRERKFLYFHAINVCRMSFQNVYNIHKIYATALTSIHNNDEKLFFTVPKSYSDIASMYSVYVM